MFRETKRRSWGIGLGLVTVLLALWVAQAGSLEPEAPPAPTMKPLHDLEPRIPVQYLGGSESAQFVIEEPGSYYLIGNIPGREGMHTIEILSNDVTLDLMGFMLLGGPGTGDGIKAQFLERIVIRNGIVQGFDGDGVNLHTSSEFLVEHVTSSGNGGWGILGQNGIGRVLDCYAERNLVGIDVAGGLIARSVSRYNENSGFQIGSTGGVVTDVNAEGNAGWGMTQNAGTGWRIENSSINRNDLGGLSVCGNNLILNNLFEGNIGDGIRVRCGGNVVRGNSLIDNTTGIFALDNGDEIVTGNYAQGNGTSYSGFTGNHFGPIETVLSATHPHANISE
jgi:parallel beta-helix repeat protein